MTRSLACATLLFLLSQFIGGRFNVRPVSGQGPQTINPVAVIWGVGKTDVSLSPIGEQIAYFDDEGVLTLYDLDNLEIVRTFESQTRLTSRTGIFAWSPDGRFIGADYEDGARVWDVGTGDLVGYFASNNLFMAPFSPDSSLIAMGQSNELVIYDLLASRVIFSLEDNDPFKLFRRIAFQPGGTLLAIEYWSGIEIWDYEQGTLVALYHDESDRVHSLAFSPDGRLFSMASASTDLGEISVWDSHSFELMWTYEAPLPVVALDWLPTANRLIAHFSSRGLFVREGRYYGEAVRILNAESGDVVAQIALTDSVSLFVDLDEDEVIHNKFGELVNVLNMNTGYTSRAVESQEANTYTLMYEIFDYALSRDETMILTGVDNGQLYVWDTATGEQIAATFLEEAEEVKAKFVAMSAQYIVSVSGCERRIMLWQITDA